MEVNKLPCAFCLNLIIDRYASTGRVKYYSCEKCWRISRFYLSEFYKAKVWYEK